ncbi:hypothetical protein [Bradyrhizobium sp. WU425]|uniref:hypothetical protein n=1 Tax=Bradyrhizobium sp. WU425 TaxID=187029 RepID=UPI001E4843AC|nr:hypothetical protein [Bradyrhizobium canariense]UFW75215.1 hypothetical protein BcanWU425_16170 [Bradyrhizobium canariense]
MTALVSYSTGTVSVAAGGTTVTGVGPIWNDGSAKPGDILQIGNFQSVISDVTDATHLVIPPWGGGAQAGVAYKIWQVSPQRFAGAEAMATVNRLVIALNAREIPVIVSADETLPDPSLGEEDQTAIQPTTGKVWVMTSGVWTYLGIYRGFNLTGAYNGATTYSVGDVMTDAGTSYVWINPTPGSGHAAPNATYWQVVASKGDTGPTGATGAGYGGTSTTSLAIGTGSRVFGTQAGLAYTNGARVRASSAANTANWMEGLVTYSGTTLTMTSAKVGGSGTFADWNLNVVGESGAGDLSSASNLSDLASAATARKNLGLPAMARSYLAGLTLSTGGSSSTFAAAAGVAVDDSSTDFMSLAASISKTTGAWAVGTGNGALDTGTIANSTWYHAYLIKRPDTGVVDVLISTSASAPTLPTNYTLKRRIGSMKTDGSGNWTRFSQLGDKFLWAVPTQDDVSAVGTTAALVTLNVPTGIQVDAEIFGLGVNTASGTTWMITSPDQTDTLPATSIFSGIVGANSVNVTYSQVVRTNTSGQIRKRASAATTTIYVNTFGWTDRRGKDS